MECETCHKLLSPYLDGQLGAQQPLVLGHLANCAPCRERARDLKRLMQAVARFPAPLPEVFKQRLLGRARLLHPRGWRLWWPRLAAACVGAVLIMGGWGLLNHLNRPTAPDRVDPDRMALVKLLREAGGHQAVARTWLGEGWRLHQSREEDLLAALGHGGGGR